MTEQSHEGRGNLPERADGDTRQKRLAFLREKMERLFEGEKNSELRQQIERSFSVPQYGEYHKEGLFMDSHLRLIFHTIEAVRQGNIPDTVSEATATSLQKALVQDPDMVERYVFLHDIAKADCLTVKFASLQAAQEAERTTETQEVCMTWAQWKDFLGQDEVEAKVMEEDERAMQDYLDSKEVMGISYYHPDRKHGDAGSQMLRELYPGVEATTLIAIEHHEDAFQFQKVDTERYLLMYEAMNKEERDFALLASYVDTASSFRSDGQPDLLNFLALSASKEKVGAFMRVLEGLDASTQMIEEAFRIFVKNRLEKRNNPREPITQLLKALAQGRFDANKLIKTFDDWFFGDQPVRMEEVPLFIERWNKECTLPSFDRERLKHGFLTLVEGAFTQEDAITLTELALMDASQIGRQFGKKLGSRMAHVREILEQSKK
ncbi:TPA: hypothetical protein DEP34_02850 [Candidatus Uhrbacteria bacterium]|uniref:Uncharacterized protein n=2 Tax=Candidatus Uhriibacteriota TaxID=1752732 RepID=A0A0G1Q8N6_9BACT|nr:MAG: hypothetical protein UX45_C0001G0015 [Candidatus Uhrbacteria bacterium GW2011_GWF2_46_218]KKU41421.1 MAG: hypothetical protein UX57_C0004G0125 [Candidatus Uhrbacteria bacterium GW2011_GWE2_46_68]HBK33859.1 hypothetical protein [Candidatus Uhrbacteria bacterium]HCB19301.1 hypothetical protein [Candidatus Uhrbacteria bacterium]